MREDGVSLFGTEDAGEGGRTPSPAGLKGLQEGFFALAGVVFLFRREWGKAARTIKAGLVIPILYKFENRGIVLGL